MTYRVGDGMVTYPVADEADPPANLDFPPAVIARRWLIGNIVELSGVWQGAPGAARDLTVPLATLARGRWTLKLVVPDDTDLTLGSVVID